MNKSEKLYVWIKIALSLAIGFLVAYPICLYGRHFLIQ